MRTTDKGDIAELAIAANLATRGYRVLVPFGVSGDYDLVIDRNGNFERIQVKYASLVDGVIPVRSRTHSNTSNKQVTRCYTESDIDWLAIYEPISQECFYIHSDILGEGKSILHLRVERPKSNHPSIRMAKDYQQI